MTADSDNSLPWLSAAEQVDRMAAGDLSPVALMRSTLAAMVGADASLHALVGLDSEAALAAAGEAERRLERRQGRALEGLPVPIKDNVDQIGARTSNGSAAAEILPVATADAPVVARLRAAGAIPVGRTRLPELGAIPATEGRGGATGTPWDPRRTAGGSSGGAAALVAAGAVAAAHGNDAGGSLRIPASCCGVVGIKPSRGRTVPGYTSAPMFGLGVDGVITRTVRDQALLLDYLLAPTPESDLCAPPLSRPLTAEIGAPVEKLRVGVASVNAIGVEPEPECVAAMRRAADILATLGHEVEDADFTWEADDVGLILDAYGLSVAASAEELRLRGVDPAALEPHNHAMWRQAAERTALQYESLRRGIAQLGARIRMQFARWDVVVTPVVATAPPLIGEMTAGSDGDPSLPLILAGAFAPYTIVTNVSGQPSASLPLGWDGPTPSGAHLVVRLGADDLLLRLCSQIEAAAPWADHRPPRHVV